MCPTQALSRIAVCVNESFSDVFPGPASKGLILHGTEKKITPCDTVCLG